MGRLTPSDWPAPAVALDGNGLALVLLALPAGSPRPTARRQARQALRQIVGHLLALSPDDVVLSEGENGPQLGPQLADATRDLRISLSYAADRCLIGLAEGQALGVDLVRIEALPEIAALAELYLPARCRQAIDAAPAEERAARFAQAWAEMEARSKCLRLPLVEMDAQRERSLAAARLVDCAPIPGYRLAIALGA